MRTTRTHSRKRKPSRAARGLRNSALIILTAAVTALTGSLVAGCGLAGGGITVVGANPGSMATVVARTTLTAASTTTSTNDACRATSLRLQAYVSPLTAPQSAALTRDQTLTLVFTNTSGFACTLRGYPSVDFLRAGIRGPLSTPDAFSASASVTPVRLASGAAASAAITFATDGSANGTANGSATTPGGSRCEDVIGVRVYPPDSVTALSTEVTDSRTASAISHFSVCGHRVDVGSIQAQAGTWH